MKIWLFAALLVLWGNLLHPLIGSSAVLPGGSWQFVLAGLLSILGSLVAARLLGLGAAALGLRLAGAARGVALGALVAGTVAATAVAVLRLGPSIIGEPLGYAPLARVSGDELARHIAVYLPLGAVIPEEVAFRGTLLGGLLARLSVRGAVIVSAAAFALWHTTVALYTVGDTALAQTALFAPAVAGALAVVFAGGVIMAGLRIASGTLATSIAAHWVFNAVILVGLWTDGPVP